MVQLKVEAVALDWKGHPVVVLREQPGSRRDRFEWLDPPAFAGSITVADIAARPTPEARIVRANE